MFRVKRARSAVSVLLLVRQLNAYKFDLCRPVEQFLRYGTNLLVGIADPYCSRSILHPACRSATARCLSSAVRL